MGFWGNLKDFMVGKDQKDFASSLDNAGYMQDYLKRQLDSGKTPQSTAAQLGEAAQLAGGPQEQARLQQMQLAQRLSSIGSGLQKGAGELAVDRQVGQAQAAQQALARSARGAQAGLALRNAARANAGIGLSGAGQAQQAALNDQLTANQALGGVLSGLRGQDLDLAGQNAQLLQQRNLQQGAFDQQTGLANQQAQLTQQQINQQYLAQLLGVDQAKLNAMLGAQQLANQDLGFLPGLLTAGGTIAGAAIGGPQGAQTGAQAGNAVGTAAGKAG